MSCVDAWLDSLPCDIIQTDIQTDIQKDLRHITPPKSVEQSQFRKRKRSQTFNAVGFMSPKKRKRDGMVGSEVESQPSASVEPPVSFSTESRQTASSSPKRSKSPARDAFNSLRYCTPAIDCRQPETKVAVLPSAIALRTHLTKGFGQRVIPIELKVRTAIWFKSKFQALTGIYLGFNARNRPLWHLGNPRLCIPLQARNGQARAESFMEIRAGDNHRCKVQSGEQPGRECLVSQCSATNSTFSLKNLKSNYDQVSFHVSITVDP